VTSTVPAPVPGVPRAAPRGTRPVRFHVDAWDPSYGTSVGLDDGLDDSTAQVDLDVERPAAQWAAVAPDPGLELPPAVLFVDGVRRIDARVWIDDLPDDPTTDRADGSRVGGLPAAGSGPGEHFAADPDTTDASGAVCASYAAGVMCCCDHRAHLLAVDARHGLFTVASHAVDILTTAGRYEVCHTTDKPAVPRAVTLSAALQSRLGQVELLTAAKARAELAGHADAAGQDLLVVDGPLRGRSHLPRTIGLIKTHQRRYLPPPLHTLIGQLTAGQRSPVFLMGTTWDRHSWYLRLPAAAGGAPWAGVARVECSADLTRDAVVRLAGLSQAVLTRYASAEYKDARAPQNLYPIGGLERELRRRLGDPQLLYRALRIAAARAAR
jgi:hypothetical protein